MMSLSSKLRRLGRAKNCGFCVMGQTPMWWSDTCPLSTHTMYVAMPVHRRKSFGPCGVSVRLEGQRGSIIFTLRSPPRRALCRVFRTEAWQLNDDDYLYQDCVTTFTLVKISMLPVCAFMEVPISIFHCECASFTPPQPTRKPGMHECVQFL